VGGRGGTGGRPVGGQPAAPDAATTPDAAATATPAPQPPTAEEPQPACTRTVPVPGGPALGPALAAALPGDCLIAADGEYPGLTIAARGTAQAPIVLRAARRGAATFTGRVQLNGAAHLVVEGFAYTGGSGVTITNGNHNRITRSRFRLGSGTWISINGTSDSNRIDHNDLGPFVGSGHFIHPTGMSERTRIDHNHLHDFPSCGGNGCESISLGCCGPVADAHETFNVVEHNLLVNCDGEGEMIGMKSSSNTVRFNTIRTSRGHISFRAGKKNTVHSNYILGGSKAGANGIRMLDEDHLVYNNYVDVPGFPLRMQHGDIPGFPPIKRARVVNNTFVVNGAAIELGGTSHSIAPAESILANNLIIGAATLINDRSGGGIELQGNIAFAMGGTVGIDRPAAELRVVDPQVAKVGEIWRPTAGGPTVDAARGGFPFVSQDIDGQPRATPDVGAHEAGVAPRGPLTPADVGPDVP
jgi:poly(beta-D-mannuronate) lyase